MKRALIVGAGSIGLRHAALLTEMGVEVTFVTSRVDISYECHSSIQDAVTIVDPDYVVVANQTSQHQLAIDQLQSSAYNGPILLEKPAQVSFNLKELEWSNNVGVAFNLRFHPVMEILRQQVIGESVISIQAYAGQDLDTWRPERSTTDQYSSHAALGGGVLRDLSHELDYLMWLFGEVTSVTAVGGKLTRKTISSDDCWSILMSTKSVPAISLSLNYLDKPGSRSLHIVTSENTYHADFSQNTFSKNGECVFSTELDRNTTYRAMHSDMLSKRANICSLNSALLVDALISDIEQSAKKKVWIER